MKNALLILSVAFSFCAFAQDKPAAPADTNAKGHCMMAAKEGQCGPAESRMRCPSRSMGEKGVGCMQEFPCGKRMPWGPPRGLHPTHKFLFVKLVLGLAFLGFLAYMTLNVLLTVLVVLDMKQRACFNGLWIPLLLIAGIPVSIIYALFRLGDNMKQG
jgi:hypothetical protein